jgi:hypothetical protein
VAEISTSQKWAIAGRLLGSRARKNRLLSSVSAGASAGWRSMSKVLFRLWHEVTGFVFLCLMVIGVSAIMREYQHYSLKPEYGAKRLVLAVGFTLMFGWFGVSSFWRSRKPGTK